MTWPKFAHSCSSSQVAMPLLRDHNIISAGVILRIVQWEFIDLFCFRRNENHWWISTGQCVFQSISCMICPNFSDTWRPKRQRRKSSDPRISNPKSIRLGMGHWISSFALESEAKIDRHKSVMVEKQHWPGPSFASSKWTSAGKTWRSWCGWFRKMQAVKKADKKLTEAAGVDFSGVLFLAPWWINTG